MNDKTTVSTLKRVCMSIGALPTSYLDSMSYYEMLVWFTKYLTEEVTPAVNNNAEAVKELQSYVEHYFDNLDIEEEVDKKLDEMASSGELAELISQYLESQAIIGFNTCSELAAAENLVNGSLVKTFGENNYYDTKGAFYKVRTRLNADDPDGYNLIELTNTDNLVAQKVGLSDYQIESSISTINDLKRVALYIGNSYTNGTGSTSGSDGIFNLTKDLFDAAYKKTGSGTGFLAYTDHTSDTFLTLLTSAINDSNIPNSEITDVIIVGAWGDTRALRETITNGGSITSYASSVQTACSTFVTNAKTNFPKLKRISYVFAESRSQKTITHTYPTQFSDAFWVHNRFLNLLPKNNIEYLGWIGFNILMDSNYFSSDHFHPNDAGYKHLSTLFKTAYNGTLTYKPLYYSFTSTPCGITSGSSATGNACIYPETTSIILRSFSLASGSTPAHSAGADLIDFANLNFTIPYPTGASSNFELGNGFMCATKRPQDNDWDTNLNYNARLQLQKSSVDDDSVVIRCITYGGSKTVSQTINPIFTPVLLSYNNGYTTSSTAV